MRIPVLVATIMLVSCGERNEKPDAPDKPVVTTPQQQTVKDVTPLNYLDYNRLKGSVKSLRQMTYEVTDGDEGKRKLSAFGEGNFFVTLNEKGWMLTTVYYNAAGGVKKTDSAFFNDYGHCTGFRSYNGDHVHENTTNRLFDRNGKLSQMTLIDTLGRTNMVATYTNDMYGYPRKTEVKRPSGRIISSADFVHDANGLMLSTTNYDGNGMVKSTESFTYDENGNLTESTSDYTDPPSSEKKTYRYEFDEHGNWTMKRTINSEGKVIEMVGREFEYFAE